MEFLQEHLAYGHYNSNTMASKDSKNFLERLKYFATASPVPWALGLLVFANVFFGVWDPLKDVDPNSLLVARNWVWWASNEFSQKEQPPQIALLGSSVIMHPLWLQEAAYRNSDVDLVADHRSKYLEHVIRKNAPVNNAECFNFALPGSMCSDDFMVVRSMFKGARKPEIVVIALTPRDMMDNRFDGAISSRHYQYLSRFTDTSWFNDLAMPQFSQKVDYYLNRALYFKGPGASIPVIASQYLRTYVGPLLAPLGPSPLDKKTEEDRRFALYQPQIEKGLFVAHPHAPDYFIDDQPGMKSRFKTPNDAVFFNQRQWLHLALEGCKKENIKVLLVNMPLSPMAMAIVPPAVYARHIECLKEAATKWDCAFLDANVPGEYTALDFTDWAHMDASGGEKVLNAIGKSIASNVQMTARLNAPLSPVSPNSPERPGTSNAPSSQIAGKAANGM